MLYTLSRKEGWRRYVDTPARRRPEPLTAGQLAALSGRAREDYDEARHDWHANFGILRTPQLAAVHQELELIVTAGRCDPDRVRGAAVIDALPGLGKTTAANSFARGFDLAQVRRHGPLTGEGHERIPVFRVGLTSNTTLRTLNLMICQFYGHPGAGRASAAQLAGQAVDCVLSCETRIGIIDDLHFIDPRRKDGLDVSNHLKWLASGLPATFIYAGIDVERSGLFTGTRGRQLAGRCELISTGAFPYRQEWTQLIAALEATLRLHRHEPGTLPAQARYLHQRTGGMIGSLTHLIRGAAIRAILGGEEAVTRPLLDTVRIDHAAESATRRTSSTR